MRAISRARIVLAGIIVAILAIAIPSGSSAYAVGNCYASTTGPVRNGNVVQSYSEVYCPTYVFGTLRISAGLYDGVGGTFQSATCHNVLRCSITLSAPYRGGFWTARAAGSAETPYTDISEVVTTTFIP